MKIVSGNILEAEEKYIVHQLNCVSIGAGGLAYHLFDKFPYADVYKTRSESNPHRVDTPGDIVICGNDIDQRYVIGIYGQYYPGSSNSSNDTEEMRKQWFFQGLKKIRKIPNIESIAFPARIGCGLAGGDWNFYYNLLEKFSESLPNTDVTIYDIGF